MTSDQRQQKPQHEKNNKNNNKNTANNDDHDGNDGTERDQDNKTKDGHVSSSSLIVDDTSRSRNEQKEEHDSHSHSSDDTDESSNGGSDDGDIKDDDSDDSVSLTNDANHGTWERDNATLLSHLAIFGNSRLSLLASFLLFATSLLVAIGLELDYTHIFNQWMLGPMPTIYPPHVHIVDASQIASRPAKLGGSAITQDMKEAFDRDGVIAIRGLLDPALLSRLIAASDKLLEESIASRPYRAKRTTHGGRGQHKKRQFHTVENGVALKAPPSRATNHSDHESFDLPSFLETAIASPIPQVAASLLRLDESNRDNDDDHDGNGDTLRLFRDIFLAKDSEQFICGWHVDDFGFWPADADSPGINAWIALDDIPSHSGGGFAVAIGSHTARWREQAYKVTGATPTIPKEGFHSAADMVANRTGEGTCNIKSSAPHLHQRMEDTSRVYDVQRGDVIFHTRWLFHRTVPFNKTAMREARQTSSQTMDADDHTATEPLAAIYKRYSIRYSPGTARIPKGYGFEPSVLYDESNGGRTADEIVAEHGPWYPRAWPSPSKDELRLLPALIESKMPVAQRLLKQRQKEMAPHLRKMRPAH